jgi:UDP-N-acetylmuramate dehydrogenase
MLTLREFIEKINTESRSFPADIRFDEPMAAHTTFKVGGPADLWVRPKDRFPEYAALLLGGAKKEGIPVFILGGGANVVVSDRGIRGIVLDTGGWNGVDFDKAAAVVRSGTTVDDAAEAAAGTGLGGLEFLAGMPGATGGAVWMNARCYEKSISDILVETEILTLEENPVRVWEAFSPADWSYKKSPFQNREVLILSARFRLSPRPTDDIRREMEDHRRDREAKGHYRFPSAGSAFKNNRDFGKPTGKIIDELGLRGFAIGAAAVAPWHGNIIINTGGAAAADIQALTLEVAARVKASTGFTLEPEILFVGEI